MKISFIFIICGERPSGGALLVLAACCHIWTAHNPTLLPPCDLAYCPRRAPPRSWSETRAVCNNSSFNAGPRHAHPICQNLHHSFGTALLPIHCHDFALRCDVRRAINASQPSAETGTVEVKNLGVATTLRLPRTARGRRCRWPCRQKQKWMCV